MENSRTLFPLLLPTMAKLESESLQAHSDSTGVSGPLIHVSLPLGRMDADVLWKMYVPVPSKVATPRTPSPNRWPLNTSLTHWPSEECSTRQSVESSLLSHHPPQTTSWLDEVLKAANPYRESGSCGMLHLSSSKPNVSAEERGPSDASPPRTTRPGGADGAREPPGIVSL